jgi:hypothetical protein
LRDAQDEFLRILLINLEDRDALHGLVAVRRQMAGDDPRVLRRQAAEYEDAIRRGTETREHYTLPAMEALVSASLEAAKEIEARSRPSSRPFWNATDASRRPAGPRAEEEALSNGRVRPPMTRSGKPIEPQTPLHADGKLAPPVMHSATPTGLRTPGLSRESVPKAAEKPPTSPSKRTPPVPAASAHQAPPPPAASAPQVSPSAGPGPQTSPQTGASAATWGLSSPQTPPPPTASAATWGLSSPQMSPPPTASAATWGLNPRTPTPSPDPSRLYMVRVGPVTDHDLAAAITKRLGAGGFSQTNVTSRTGFRVVSEPLPRSVAEGLIAKLAGRGFHSQLEPLAGDTVQLVFGTFNSQKEAETLSQRIAAAGYDAWVREGVVYTVQLGPYPQSSVNAITGIIKSSAPGAAVTADPVP